MKNIFRRAHDKPTGSGRTSEKGAKEYRAEKEEKEIEERFGLFQLWPLGLGGDEIIETSIE